jgi:hypothetical protein
MAAPVPQKLQVIAGIQIVSGVFNGLVMSGLVTSLLFAILGTGGSVIAGCTAWFCPLTALAPCASFCGLWGLGLLPIGLVEVVCGVATLLNPDNAKNFVKIGMFTELGSVLFGGVTSFVAGMVIRGLVTDPEVAGFLEAGPDAP